MSSWPAIFCSGRRCDQYSSIILAGGPPGTETMMAKQGRSNNGD